MRGWLRAVMGRHPVSMQGTVIILCLFTPRRQDVSMRFRHRMLTPSDRILPWAVQALALALQTSRSHCTW